MFVALRRVVPAALLALVGPLLLAGPAVSVETGSITGTVTARPAGGTPAPYADATVYVDRLKADGWFESAGSATPAANGTFTVAGLADGQYRLSTYPFQYGAVGQYGYEYYDNQWAPYDVTLVTVSGGLATQLPRAIELRPTGRITGNVTDEQGKPVLGDVAFRASGTGGAYGTPTDATGVYDSSTTEWARNLIPGDYLISFSPKAWGPGNPEYYPVDEKVTVTPGATARINIVLQRRPTATFTVLDTDGTPLAGAPLRIEIRDDWTAGEWQPIQSGPHETDAQGRYRFTDTVDAVRFQVSPPPGYAGTGQPEWWDNAADSAGATVLEFPAGVAMDRQFTIRLDPPAVGKLTAVRPRVSGKATVGRALRAVAGAWRPAPVRLTYQWLRNGKPVKGRTTTSYRLAKADVGKRISVRVTGRKASYAAAAATSRPTPKVRRR